MKPKKAIKGKVPQDINGHIEKIMHEMNSLLVSFTEEKQKKIWQEIETLSPLIPKNHVMNEHFHLLKEELSQVFSSLERAELVVNHCMKIQEDLIEL
jgi:hypothetical protein